MMVSEIFVRIIRKEWYAVVFVFLMIRRPPRSTLDRSSAASDVYKRQSLGKRKVFGAGDHGAIRGPDFEWVCDSLR